MARETSLGVQAILLLGCIAADEEKEICLPCHNRTGIPNSHRVECGRRGTALHGILPRGIEIKKGGYPLFLCPNLIHAHQASFLLPESQLEGDWIWVG